MTNNDIDNETEDFMRPARKRGRVRTELFYVRMGGQEIGPFDPEELDDYRATLRGSFRIVPA